MAYIASFRLENDLIYEAGVKGFFLSPPLSYKYYKLMEEKGYEIKTRFINIP